MDEPWLVAAKKLPPGGKGRFAHECGSDEAMIINNGVKGYSAYCNRCHATPFVPHGVRTFKELMELRKLERQHQQELSAEVKLPYDFTLDIPAPGMLWLLKASITPHRARELGIGYSKYFNRVFLPIYDQGKLVYFQARAISRDQEIKYINPRVDRSAIGYWVIPADADKSRIVITEDILSAIRVGKFVPVCCALGTHLTTPLANRLSEYDLVTTWLDPDKAGIDGAYEMRKLLRLTTKVSNIISARDPKAYADNEIKQYLNLE